MRDTFIFEGISGKQLKLAEARSFSSEKKVETWDLTDKHSFFGPSRFALYQCIKDHDFTLESKKKILLKLAQVIKIEIKSHLANGHAMDLKNANQQFIKGLRESFCK